MENDIMENDINKYFINPFNLKQIEIQSPFEKIENEEDIKKLNANFVIDYVLFTYKTMFTPFVKSFNEGDKVILQIEKDLPEVSISFQKSSTETRKSGYYINKIYKSLAFEVERVRRKDLHDVMPNKKILRIEKKHLYVINFGNIKLRNDLINEKLDVDKENFSEDLKNKVNEFSYLFLELFGNPKTYPYYSLNGDNIELLFNKENKTNEII